MRGSNKPRPVCNDRIRPRRSGLSLQRIGRIFFTEEMQMTIDLHGSIWCVLGPERDWNSLAGIKSGNR